MVKILVEKALNTYMKKLEKTVTKWNLWASPLQT